VVAGRSSRTRCLPADWSAGGAPTFGLPVSRLNGKIVRWLHMPLIDRDVFHSTLKRELRSAWEALRRAHPDERFYSFGVYTTEVVDYLMVTASTEEGLATAAKTYCDRDGGDPVLTRASLRWSPCDSPLHAEGATLLAESDGLRRAGPDPYDDTSESSDAIDLVFDVAVRVLRELDAEGIFGRDVERARLALGIWKGDQSDEERIEFGRMLNPKAVAQRFAREIEAGTEAFFKLHPS